MAITVEDGFSSTQVRAVPGSSFDKTIVAYQRSNVSNQMYVKIVTISTEAASSSLLFGALNANGGLWSLAWLNSTYVVALWNSKTGSNASITADLWDISGSSVTEATDDILIETWSGAGAHVAVCTASTTVTFGIFYNGALTSGRLVEMGRSGSTLSETSTDNITLADSIMDIDALTTTKVICTYLDGSNFPTVTAVETSGGITQGSAVTLESAAYTNSLAIVTLSSSLAIVMYSGGTVVKLVAMTISGTTIAGGTPLEVAASGGDAQNGLVKLNSTTVAANFDDGSSNVMNTYTISGTTFTAIDSISADDGDGDIAVLANGKIVLAYSSGNVLLQTDPTNHLLTNSSTGIPGSLI